MITIDAKQFRVAVNRFKLASDRDMADVIKQQSGLVAVRAALVQPHINGKQGNFSSPGTWQQQKKSAQEMIAAQNFGKKGAFIEDKRGIGKKALNESQTRDILFLCMQNGKRLTAKRENIVASPDRERMSQFRRPYWSNGKMDAQKLSAPEEIGKRTLRLKKMLVSTSAKNAWLKHQWSKIGRAKAGWIVAAEKTGYLNRLPTWVRRHTQSPGSAIEIKSDTFKGWEIANEVEHANNHQVAPRVMQHALNYQANQMMKQLETLLEKQAFRFNKAA